MTYEVATLEEYGFKKHTGWKITWKCLRVFFVVLTVFMLYASIGVIALQSLNSSRSTTEFSSFTFQWYQEMFSNRLLNQAIKNTFIVSVSATLISTICGTLIAVGIYYLPTKKRQRILLLNNIPLLNADIVTGITLMLLFSCLLPLFPYFFGFPTLLLAHVFFTLPYIILSVMPKLREMDSNLMDAANDLGIKPLKSVRKVIIPAVKAGIFSGMVLAFTVSFEDFAVSYFTTGNGFDNMSIWIYASVGKRSLFPGVYAFSTFLTLLSIIGVVLYSFVLKGHRRHEKNH